MAQIIQKIPNPKPGEFWRHYKGGRYKIIGVSDRPNGNGRCTALVTPATCFATHTETEAQVAIYEVSDRFYLVSALTFRFILEPHVIYRGKDGVWARPLDSFLEVLGDIHDRIQATTYPRFQLVKNVEKTNPEPPPPPTR